jgi:RNA polymerase sigma-70 factor (ECF subfamily)
MRSKCPVIYEDAAVSREGEDLNDCVRRVTAGDDSALAELFSHYRGRLRQMVRLRLDRRLQRRVDPSDVLQEAYLDMNRRLTEFARNPSLPVFLWMRLLTGQRLVDVHRQHLGAQARDAGREVSLHHGEMPEANSASLAERMLGQITSASQAAQRAELQLLLQDALNGMDSIDREILALRHFEMLTNSECAQVLLITQKAASNRYIRALARLKTALDAVPGFKDYFGKRG